MPLPHIPGHTFGVVLSNPLASADFAPQQTFPTDCFPQSVAVADVNGDDRVDIVTGAGPGGGPQVKAIDGARLAQVDGRGEIADSALPESFFAFDLGFTGGIFVAAGSVLGNGHDQVLIGPGAG